LNPYCRKCVAVCARARRDRATPHEKEQRRENERRQRQISKTPRQRLWRVLSAYQEFFGCELCGQKGPSEIFDFHHTDPTTKKFSINAAEIKSHSCEEIIDEFEKCMCLDAACHRLVGFTIPRIVRAALQAAKVDSEVPSGSSSVEVAYDRSDGAPLPGGLRQALLDFA